MFHSNKVFIFEPNKNFMGNKDKRNRKKEEGFAGRLLFSERFILVNFFCYGANSVVLIFSELGWFRVFEILN